MKNHIKRNTMVRTMLKDYGEPYLHRLWQQSGGAPMAAEAMSEKMGCWVTAGRFEYLSKLYNWRRSIRPDHPIALGVKYGTKKKEDYPRMIFPGDDGYEG